MSESHLRLSSQQDPQTLDPQICSDRISSAITFLLYKGLIRLEADRTLRCDLADSFQISNDGKTYFFHLGNHYWSDGHPIAAQNFVDSWRRALHPDFPCDFIHFFYPIKNAKKGKQGILPSDAIGIHAKNEKTLIVELEHPCPHFLELTSFCTLFPIASHSVQESVASVYSGSFLLESWTRGKEIVLKKNPYSKNLSGVRLDGITIQIVPNRKEAFALFEKGELDWIGDPISPLPLNYLPALIQTKKIKPVAGIVSCSFNTKKSPFRDLELRRAFFHAIPHEAIIQKLMLPNISPCLPGILRNGARTSWRKESIVPLSSEAIGKLIRSKHPRLTLAYEMVDEHARLAMVLKNHWEERFPVSIVLVPLPFKEFFEIVPKHNFHMVLYRSISTYTDPISFLERLEFEDSPKNLSKWQSADYQDLLRKYRKTLNQDQRMELAERAEALLFDQLPIAPLYSYHYSYLQKPYVKNLAISPIGVVQFDRVLLDKKELMAETTDSRLFEKTLSS